MVTTILEPKAMASAVTSPGRARPVEDLSAPIEHVSLILSTRTLDAVYPALILARSARVSGIDATLFFTFRGLDLVTKTTVDHLHLGLAGESLRQDLARLRVPTVREMIRGLADAGARLYACWMSLEMFGRTRADLLPEVTDVITAVDFFEKSVGAQLIYV